MARKTASRIAKRREAEAAGNRESSAKKPRKAARKKKTTTSRRKSKAPDRKRLVWGVFSSSLKEEARFPYDQRKEAEKKLEQLLAKGKRLYFIQPIKEVITETPVAAEASVDEEASAKSEEE